MDEDGAAHRFQGPPGDSSPWAESLSGHCPLSRPTGRGHLENKGQTPKSYKPSKQILALQELHWSIELPTAHEDLNASHLAKSKSQPGPNSSTPSMTFLRCRILSVLSLGPRRQSFSNKFICKISLMPFPLGIHTLLSGIIKPGVWLQHLIPAAVTIHSPPRKIKRPRAFSLIRQD